MLQPKEEVDEKYYLSQEVQDRLQITDETLSKNVIGTTKPQCRTIGERDVVYNHEKTMGTITATSYKQPPQILSEQPISLVDENKEVKKKESKEKKSFFSKIFKW